MLLTNLQFIFQTHNIKQSALSFAGTKSFVHKLNFRRKSQKVSLWTKLYLSEGPIENRPVRG